MKNTKSISSKFIAHFEASPDRPSNPLKRLVRNVSTLDLEHAFKIFRAIENHYFYPDEFKNLFPRRIDFISLIFGNYMIEKAIIYAEGKCNVCINTIQTNTRCSTSDIYLSSLYNDYNAAMKPNTKDISPLASIMLAHSSEQFKFQIQPMPAFERFYYIFSKNKEVNKRFYECFEISLENFSLLSFALYAYIVVEVYKESKHRYFIHADEFANYIERSTNITKDQVKIFLDSISLDRETYKSYYMQMRQTDDIMDSFEKQEMYDRALPKISHSYPLLRYQENYVITSIASLLEFLKMDRLYRMLTMEIHKDFKSTHIGPAIEEYARMLIHEYSKLISDLQPVCSGNQEYRLNKQKKDAPDAILETKDYILFIECKASAFNINLFKTLRKENLNRLIKDVDTSMKNIDNYLAVHNQRLGKKRIIKLLAYYEGQSDWYELLLEDSYGTLEYHDMLIVNFNILELLLGSYTKPIPELIDEYLSKRESYSTNFEAFLIESGASNWKHNDNDSVLKELAQKNGMHI